MPRGQSQFRSHSHPYQQASAHTSYQYHQMDRQEGHHEVHHARDQHSQQLSRAPHHQVHHVRAQHSQQGRHTRPVYNPHSVRRDEVQASQDENQYGDRLCELCSDKNNRLYHHHLSSQKLREFATKYQSNYLFYCLMCKMQESIVRPNTRKLILTSSTLYNVWSIESLKLPIHIDIESIVGGRIRDLTRALIMLYLKHPERLEIILIAGLNNIGDNQPAEDIIEEIRELKQTVQAHSELHSHSETSIVSVSTILYAPKFCSLDVPDKCEDWKPPVGFNNRRDLIENVNAAIKAINVEDKVNYLKLHMEGIRLDKKTGKKLHKHYPDVPIWRETEVRRRLHLTSHYKAKIARNAAKLFVGGLKNLGDWTMPAKT